MAMSKRDYEAITHTTSAEVAYWRESIGTTRHDESEIEGAIAALSSLVQRLAVVIKQDNPRFDRTKFLKACGLSD